MDWAIIGWPSHTAAATWDGAAATGYPAGHLGQYPLSRVWRSPDLAAGNTEVTWVFDTAHLVDLVVLCRHNLTMDALWRLSMFEDAARSVLVYDSGWMRVWGRVYPHGMVPWGHPSFWGGNYLPADISGQTALRPHRLAAGPMFPYPTSPSGLLPWGHREFWGGHYTDGTNGLKVRAGRVEFADPLNPAGYVEAGLIDLAEEWLVSLPPAVGAGMGVVPRSLVVEADGGGRYGRRRRALKTFRGTVEYLERDEALARGFEWQRRADLTDAFLWWPDPDDLLHFPRRAFMARHEAIDLLAHQEVGRLSLPLSLTEAV